MKTALSILFIFLVAGSLGQTINDEFIISKFKSIGENPTNIEFENNKKVNNSGGHLQGIQFIQKDTNKYVFLSGSSDSYAYLSVVKLGNTNEVISINHLNDKPFKHAGGIQVFENYLVVGIEDNEKKDKSKVCIYNISNPENLSLMPVAVIERNGEPLCSTAGCVGISKYKDKALVAVGDWDTQNIDFYSCNFQDIEKGGFKKIQSISTEKMSRHKWIDKNWHSYQNINLFNFDNDLYLVGLGQNDNQENVADLYRLKEKNAFSFELIKLASKTFNCENHVSFKAGAGVVFSETGEMKIISCGNNLRESAFLNYFINKILPAHAHNDYEHERPLFDALASNFKSIEADVFSIGDSLYVAHNFEDIEKGRTLRELYLSPLKAQIEKNQGSVYGNGEEIILLIDIKDDGLKTYKILHNILEDYKDEISVFENGTKCKKAVLVVISGNRSFDFMKSQKIRYAGFDGRLEDLDSGISPILMPLVSDNWRKHFSWDGEGEVPVDEYETLQILAAKAKNQGYVLRFWGTPNQTSAQRVSVWRELMKAGVGLIGADNLKELAHILSK